VTNGVKESTCGREQRKKEFLAEARANRAYMHLMQVNYFAKPYLETTAAGDPGIPIVALSDAGASDFKRNTVKEVYDFIISELKAAIPDLPKQTVNRARLAKTGGHYILGLTYFWMRDYDNALIELNNARNTLPDITIPMGLYNYNTTMPTWVTAGKPWLGASKHPAQTLSSENIYVKQISINWATSNNTVYLKTNVYGLYGTSDQRIKFFYNNSTTNTIPAPGLPGQQRNGPTSYNWGPSLPDLYLMIAECKARKGDLTGAKADLELLRKNRMSTTDAKVTIITEEAMVKLILQERKREFAGTGWRWFDMRRLSNDPVYNNIDGIHPLDGTEFVLKPDRLVLRIPPAILTMNPGMQDNP